MRFVEQSNERRLPPDYRGDVVVSDIDRTYLDTHFSSLRGLLRIPFELAVDKLTIPGAAPVLRALRRGPAGRDAVPLYFVSGSPPQIRRVIERKMMLDGVDFDGITFKDQFGLLRAGRPRSISAQLAYKVRALLSYARELPEGCRFVLLGDDTESDADAFVLFGEVVAGLRGAGLDERLLGTERWERRELLEMAESFPVRPDPVDLVFIHLARGTDPARLAHPKVIPTRSYLQTALVLAHRGKIAADGIGAVAKALRRRLVTEPQIAEHLEDARRRLGVPEALLAAAEVLPASLIGARSPRSSEIL